MSLGPDQSYFAQDFAPKSITKTCKEEVDQLSEDEAAILLKLVKIYKQ
jgi:hypothetical protein